MLCFSPFYINNSFWTVVMFKPFMGCVLFSLNVCVFTIYIYICVCVLPAETVSQLCTVLPQRLLQFFPV